MKHILKESKILYDGGNSVENPIRIITNEKIIIDFDWKIIFNTKLNALIKLESIFTKQNFNQLVEEGDFKQCTPKEWGYYKITHAATLNYLIQNNYLFVFTDYEKQPGRDIIILEGIWDLNDDFINL